MEVRMKKITLSLVLAASLGLAACGSDTSVVKEDFGDAQAAVDAAETQKTAAVIKGQLTLRLEQSGNDIPTLKKLYEEASAAGVDSVAAAVDKKLEAEFLPKAKAAKRSSEVLALKKQLPIGSPIFKKLDVIDGQLLDAEAKSKALQ